LDETKIGINKYLREKQGEKKGRGEGKGGREAAIYTPTKNMSECPSSHAGNLGMEKLLKADHHY